MKKTILAVLIMLFSSGLAGCIEDSESGVQYISSADCGGFWHVEFVDMSNDDFNAWEGEVQFVGSDGSTETISDFPASKNTCCSMNPCHGRSNTRFTKTTLVSSTTECYMAATTTTVNQVRLT